MKQPFNQVSLVSLRTSFQLTVVLFHVWPWSNVSNPQPGASRASLASMTDPVQPGYITIVIMTSDTSCINQLFNPVAEIWFQMWGTDNGSKHTADILCGTLRVKLKLMAEAPDFWRRSCNCNWTLNQREIREQNRKSCKTRVKPEKMWIKSSDEGALLAPWTPLFSKFQL